MRPTLHLLIGIAGIGKSSYAVTLGADVIVSSDSIRQELTGDANDLSRDSEMWPLYRARIWAALDAGQTVVADATHLTPKSREFAEAAAAAGFRVVAHVFPADLSLALERNARRERQVPPEVITTMWFQAKEMNAAELLCDGFEVHPVWKGVTEDAAVAV